MTSPALAPDLDDTYARAMHGATAHDVPHDPFYRLAHFMVLWDRWLRRDYTSSEESAVFHPFLRTFDAECAAVTALAAAVPHDVPDAAWISPAHDLIAWMRDRGDCPPAWCGRGDHWIPPSEDRADLLWLARKYTPRPLAAQVLRWRTPGPQKQPFTADDRVAMLHAARALLGHTDLAVRVFRVDVLDRRDAAAPPTVVRDYVVWTLRAPLRDYLDVALAGHAPDPKDRRPAVQRLVVVLAGLRPSPAELTAALALAAPDIDAKTVAVAWQTPLRLAGVLRACEDAR